MMHNTANTSTTDCRPTVCHISTVHVPFDTRVFQKECLSLAEAGYDVHLIACHDGDETVQGVQIHALPQPPGRLARLLRWPWHAYRVLRQIRPRPRICHFHDPELLPLGQLLRLTGYTVIYDVHENVAEQIRYKGYLKPTLRVVFSHVYRLVEKLLTRGLATLHVLESIARNYRQPREVVRNFPRLDTIPPPAPRDEPQRPRLIYVGALTRERGALTVAHLAVALKARGIDYELLLVGPCEDDTIQNEMQGILATADALDQVAFKGRLPFEAAQALVRSSDVGLCLLHPSPNHLNSLPTKLLEYMRMEVPVVASDFECWREYVTDVGAGYLVDVSSVETAADAVEQLLADSQQRQSMGARGLAAVEALYNWEKEQSRLLAFYERLLDRP